MILLNGSKPRDFQSTLFLLTDRFIALRVTGSYRKALPIEDINRLMCVMMRESKST